ncbi:MAG: MoaD/ThiS family protein [Anaerolineae bacterium]
MVEVKLTLVGMLKEYAAGEDTVTAQAGQVISEVLSELAIPPELVAVVMVNGRQESKSYRLREGDEVNLVPLVGGGAFYSKESSLWQLKPS